MHHQLLDSNYAHFVLVGTSFDEQVPVQALQGIYNTNSSFSYVYMHAPIVEIV